jgi:hypothetical protein
MATFLEVLNAIPVIQRMVDPECKHGRSSISYRLMKISEWVSEKDAEYQKMRSVIAKRHMWQNPYNPDVYIAIDQNEDGEPVDGDGNVLEYFEGQHGYLEFKEDYEPSEKIAQAFQEDMQDFLNEEPEMMIRLLDEDMIDDLMIMDENGFTRSLNVPEMKAVEWMIISDS